MSKAGLWKNIFGYREKVAVDVGGKTELLTETQSYRFSELAEQNDMSPCTSYRNPLEDGRYNLSDAAFRLMISEDEVLAKADAGELRLYVDVAGTSGHWCRRDREGKVSRSSVVTIESGWLRLRTRACADLARYGRAIVRTLDLCRAADASKAGLDDKSLADLSAWGSGEKQFSPLHPLTIERDMVVLLPPL